jgi:hypothetical protein
MSGPPQMLGLPAALHPEPVHPAGLGLPASGRHADKLALAGAGAGHPGGHQIPLGDHVVDLGVQIGKGLEEHPEELLGLLGVLAAEGMVHPVRSQQLPEGVHVPGVDDLLVEPPCRLLVVFNSQVDGQPRGMLRIGAGRLGPRWLPPASPPQAEADAEAGGRDPRRPQSEEAAPPPRGWRRALAVAGIPLTRDSG